MVDFDKFELQKFGFKYERVFTNEQPLIGKTPDDSFESVKWQLNMPFIWRVIQMVMMQNYEIELKNDFNVGIMGLSCRLSWVSKSMSYI